MGNRVDFSSRVASPRVLRCSRTRDRSYETRSTEKRRNVACIPQIRTDGPYVPPAFPPSFRAIKIPFGTNYVPDTCVVTRGLPSLRRQRREKETRKTTVRKWCDVSASCSLTRSFFHRRIYPPRIDTRNRKIFVVATYFVFRVLPRCVIYKLRASERCSNLYNRQIIVHRIIVISF